MYRADFTLVDGASPADAGRLVVDLENAAREIAHIPQHASVWIGNGYGVSVFFSVAPDADLDVDARGREIVARLLEHPDARRLVADTSLIWFALRFGGAEKRTINPFA